MDKEELISLISQNKNPEKAFKKALRLGWSPEEILKESLSLNKQTLSLNKQTLIKIILKSEPSLISFVPIKTLWEIISGFSETFSRNIAGYEEITLIDPVIEVLNLTDRVDVNFIKLLADIPSSMNPILIDLLICSFKNAYNFDDFEYFKELVTKGSKISNLSVPLIYYIRHCRLNQVKILLDSGATLPVFKAKINFDCYDGDDYDFKIMIKLLFQKLDPDAVISLVKPLLIKEADDLLTFEGGIALAYYMCKYGYQKEVKKFLK